MARASFWLDDQPHENNETSLGESHALADSNGDVEAAAVVHQMIATCVLESGYAVFAYGLDYADHYSGKGYEKRRWDKREAKKLSEQKRKFASKAIQCQDEVRRVYKKHFRVLYTEMSEPDRKVAADGFRAEMRKRFVDGSS